METDERAVALNEACPLAALLSEVEHPMLTPEGSPVHSTYAGILTEVPDSLEFLFAGNNRMECPNLTYRTC